MTGKESALMMTCRDAGITPMTVALILRDYYTKQIKETYEPKVKELKAKKPDGWEADAKFNEARIEDYKQKLKKIEKVRMAL